MNATACLATRMTDSCQSFVDGRTKQLLVTRLTRRYVGCGATTTPSSDCCRHYRGSSRFKELPTVPSNYHIIFVITCVMIFKLMQFILRARLPFVGVGRVLSTSADDRYICINVENDRGDLNVGLFVPGLSPLRSVTDVLTFFRLVTTDSVRLWGTSLMTESSLMNVPQYWSPITGNFKRHRYTGTSKP